MPYITEKERTELFKYAVKPTRESIAIAMGNLAENGGQLNYMISLAISEYLKHKGLNYATCQEIIGMLGIAKSEFIENVIIPYERLKSAENGNEIYDWVKDEVMAKWNNHYDYLRSEED